MAGRFATVVGAIVALAREVDRRLARASVEQAREAMLVSSRRIEGLSGSGVAVEPPVPSEDLIREQNIG